jgi:hypothetical protein
MKALYDGIQAEVVAYRVIRIGITFSENFYTILHALQVCFSKGRLCLVLEETKAELQGINGRLSRGVTTVNKDLSLISMDTK